MTDFASISDDGADVEAKVNDRIALQIGRMFLQQQAQAGVLMQRDMEIARLRSELAALNVQKPEG